MKLVQKLPLGLSVACLLMMSSCSNEDAQTPQPETSKQKTEAEMRGIGGGYLPSGPSVPIITGTGTGRNLLPTGWQRDNVFGSQDIEKFPIGVSNQSALWGYSSNRSFIQTLPGIAGIDKVGQILSVTVNTNPQSFDNASKSVAKTTIKGMVPGHQYELTYYVACAIPEKMDDGSPATFAEQAVTYMRYNSPAKSMLSGIRGVTNLSGKYNQWVQQKVYFTAEDTEVDLLFSGSVKYAGQWSYVHLFVDKNALKRVY